MKRIFNVICIASLCISILTPIISAHSGKTDASGGHYNDYTGEYHYHHGYSAHSHYDIDGDGVIDCPYDFKDKTSQNNFSSSAKNNTNDNITDSVGNNTNSAKNGESSSWAYWSIGGMSLVVCVMFFIIRAKNKEMAERESEILSLTEGLRNLEESIEGMEQSCIAPYVKEVDNLTSQVDSLQKQLKNSNSENIQLKQKVQNMEKAPAGITFAEDGMPIFWKKSDDKPYGDYTVFYSPKSRIYHVDRWCGSYSARRQHIFNVIRIGTPCKKCAEGFFDFTSVPTWFTNDQNQSNL